MLLLQINDKTTYLCDQIFKFIYFHKKFVNALIRQYVN